MAGSRSPGAPEPGSSSDASSDTSGASPGAPPDAPTGPQPELPGMPAVGDAERLAAAPARGRGGARRPAGGGVSAEAIEAALLEALDRPAVRARLAELAERALADALSRLAERGAFAAAASGDASALERAAGAGEGAARVLAIDLPPEQGRAISALLPPRVELRLARSGEGRERLRSQARGCSALVATEGVDPELEEFLRALGPPLVHHAGSARRLAQRLLELADAG